MQAYADWPEHALSPIGGAESRCPLLSAIRACGAASSIRAFAASKTESNVSGTGSQVLVGNSNIPMKRQDAQIN
jgi:hypothetical protein